MGLRQKCLYMGIGCLFMAFCLVFVLGYEKSSKSSSQQTEATPNSKTEVTEKIPAPANAIPMKPKALTFELIESIKFGDGTEVKSITKADIEALRDLPIYSERNDYIDGVTLINAKDEQIFVRTCREYESALEQGYYPSLPNSNMKSSIRFNHNCGLLRVLQAATTPQESFISNPKVGVIDLELLPFSFFPSVDELERMELNATYQSKVIKDVLVVEMVRQNFLTIVEPHGMGQQLVEVVRADFNGDGIEDILLFEHCFATGGTLGFGGIRILTRKSIDGKFEKVERHNSE